MVAVVGVMLMTTGGGRLLWAGAPCAGWSGSRGSLDISAVLHTRWSGSSSRYHSALRPSWSRSLMSAPYCVNKNTLVTTSCRTHQISMSTKQFPANSVTSNESTPSHHSLVEFSASSSLFVSQHLGPVYTKPLRLWQFCNDASNNVLIENNGVIPE